MTVILDIVFALSESIPKLDGLVTGARDNLPVISTEADREDIRGVADEAAGGDARVEVPEAESVVPRGRKRELAVGRDDDVGHEVVVAVEDALRVAVLVLVAGELPDDDRLVCTPDKASAPQAAYFQAPVCPEDFENAERSKSRTTGGREDHVRVF